MNDEEHLRAIRDDLDDDAPRLVYADVLSERGDPRGELIVVQCARVRLEREGEIGPELRALVAREREILSAHVKEWVNPFGLRRWWGDFERGFIAKLNITVLALRAKWPLFRTLPLREIHLRTSRRGVPLLGEMAWLAAEETSARQLIIDTGLGRATFDFPALRPLLRAVPEAESAWDKELPHRALLPALRELSINYPTREHLHALTGANVALEAFRFNVGTPILAEDMRAFVASPVARGIRDLWAGFLEDEPAIELFRAGALPALRELGVTRGARSRFPPDVGAAFAEASFVEQLTSFRSDLMLDEAVNRALSERMPALDSLDLDREAAPGEVERLLERPLMAKLRKLSVTGATGATRESASIVTRARFERLVELALHRFSITAEDARALPPVLSFHAYDCEYGTGAQESLRERWPFVRTT
jgi:uncharacterized protein (TIGR02996 family)